MINDVVVRDQSDIEVAAVATVPAAILTEFAKTEAAANGSAPTAAPAQPVPPRQSALELLGPPVAQFACVIDGTKGPASQMFNLEGKRDPLCRRCAKAAEAKGLRTYRLDRTLARDAERAKVTSARENYFATARITPRDAERGNGDRRNGGRRPGKFDGDRRKPFRW